MASTSNEVLNESAGTEVSVPCIQCSGKTAHEVIQSIDKSGYVDDYEISWERKHQIIRCKGCKTLTFRDASSNSEDHMQDDAGGWELHVYETLYPSRIEGRKDLGSDVIHLPPGLMNVYAETIQALNNDSPILAGIGLRALVETVCKDKKAAGKNLYEKINDLASNHVLTPSGAEILHKVRSLGNKAAHEVKPHTPRQLSLAMTVVEHMLRDVYILPKLVENEF